MPRISREQAFMECAEVWAKRSTCFRRNVGAVVVVNGRIVSHGYNGAPPGEPHCDGQTCCPNQICTRAIHAEKNALERVPAVLRCVPKELYVTESPCPTCAEEIARAMVTAVYFRHQYRDPAGIANLSKGGIGVFKVNPSGHVVCAATGEIRNLEEMT